MKTNLYKIQENYLNIINQVEEAEGLLTPELEEALTINESELQQKAIAYKEVIAAKESFNTRISDEIKRLQAMKKANDNLVNNLKERLLTAVKLFGVFEVGLSKFGTRKSTQVIVEDVNSLPKEYKTTKVTESADKAEIKKDLKAGKEIEGCSLLDVLNLKID